MTDRLRVIQWNTGKVGKLATRGVLDDPRLDVGLPHAPAGLWRKHRRG